MKTFFFFFYFKVFDVVYHDIFFVYLFGKICPWTKLSDETSGNFSESLLFPRFNWFSRYRMNDYHTLHLW